MDFIGHKRTQKQLKNTPNKVITLTEDKFTESYDYGNFFLNEF